jgi:hypothetical protein
MTDQQQAIARQDAAAPPQAQKSEKKQRIPKKIATAISLIVSGECRTYKAACDRVGLNASYFSQALQKPHVRVFYERRARENISAGVMRASARLIELMDSDSEHVAAEVSKHVAAIGGLKPARDAQVSVNIEQKAGYVIILTEPGDTRTFSPNTPQINEIKDLGGDGVKDV